MRLAQSAVRELFLVVGGTPNWAEPIWRSAVGTARALLGAPAALEASLEGAEEAAGLSDRDLAKRATKLTWDLKPVDESASSAHRLALEALPEFVEMYRNRARGFSGMEEPLTPEQELAAVKRRVAGAGGAGFAS